MRYDKNKLFEQAKQAIQEEGLVFIEEIVSFLPISKPTFYEYFPLDSDEMQTLRELIGSNKTEASKELFKNNCPLKKEENNLGYVYLIHCEGTNYYKIGMSSIGYKSRLSQMQSGCPFRLIMVHVVHSINYKAIEMKLHKKYKNNNHFLEWFTFTQEEVKKVIKDMSNISTKQMLLEFS